MGEDRIGPEELLPGMGPTLQRTREVSRIVGADGTERILFERVEEVATRLDGAVGIEKSVNRRTWDCHHPVVLTDERNNLNIGGQCGCGAWVCNECFHVCAQGGCGAGLCPECAGEVDGEFYCPAHAAAAKIASWFSFGWLRKREEAEDENIPQPPAGRP